MGKTDSLLTGAIQAVKGSGGSYKTRYNHTREVRRFVQTLRQTGFGVQKWQNLTNKHVAAVVDQWRSEKLSVSTIKEYLSGVRVVARYFDNDRIASDNRSFGLENRVYVTNQDRSVPQAAYERAVAALKSSDSINDNRVAAQLMLQKSLGLRKEESFKFDARRSVLQDGRILVSAGTKGGRERIVHHVSSEARSAIAYTKTVMSGNNTMATGVSERQWNTLFYRTIREHGISKKQGGASGHGLRHGYAQERYHQIAGFAAPVKFTCVEAFRENAEKSAGEDWRTLDREARSIIKGELGHHREDVVAVYVGSA